MDILIQIAPDVYKFYIMTDKKGWNSYWYSARMPYMVQWLQAYCTITNSPRVWWVSDSKSIHMFREYQTRLSTAHKWQYAFTWMTAN
jgi:hypothetical protein